MLLINYQKIEEHDQLQKFKDQLQSSNDTPTTSVNVNQDRIEQNHADDNR